MGEYRRIKVRGEERTQEERGEKRRRNRREIKLRQMKDDQRSEKTKMRALHIENLKKKVPLQYFHFSLTILKMFKVVYRTYQQLQHWL